MSDLERAALALVEARNERKKAKRALRDWFNHHYALDESYPCEHGDQGCFREYDEAGSEIPLDQWCGLCLERKVLYDHYQVTQHKQSGAMRRLDRVGNRTLATAGGSHD